MRAYYCRVCGHVEWIPEGQALPDDYRCSLCGAHGRAMIPIPGETNDTNRLALESIDEGLWCLRKMPRFVREWEHVSYALQIDDKIVLFDPPPIFNEEAVGTLSALGCVTTLILSHADFVGTAQLWKERLGLKVLMGMDEPLPGNRIEVDQRVKSPLAIGTSWAVLLLPGHSPGSIGIHGTTLSGRTALLAGDALSVWHHGDGRVQVSVFEPPGQASEATMAALERSADHLCCCTGWISNIAADLAELKRSAEPSARPYAGETGGIWL